MSRIIQSRIRRQFDEAEGYLLLNLPARALEILDKRADWEGLHFDANLLRGEALRELSRFREALKPLEKAAALRPGDPRVGLALAWCYKRTNRLAQAIDALERVLRSGPLDPGLQSLLHYNLACYWSLAGQSSKAITALKTALEINPDFRRLIPAEPDFDQLRGNADFERLVFGHAPSA